jgi:hypothetical protein
LAAKVVDAVIFQVDGVRGLACTFLSHQVVDAWSQTPLQLFGTQEQPVKEILLRASFIVQGVVERLWQGVNWFPIELWD